MKVSGVLYLLTVLLGFTVAVENLFEEALGFQSPLTAYRAVTFIIVAYLFISGKWRYLFISKSNFLIIAVFLWGTAIALIRHFLLPVDFALLLTNLALLLVNYVMFIYLCSINWDRNLLFTIVISYNTGLVVNLVFILFEGIPSGAIGPYFRTGGFFSNPNSLGFACLLGLLSSFFLFQLSSKYLRKALALVFIAVNMLLIDYSASRAAAVVALVILLMMLVWFLWKSTSYFVRTAWVCVIIFGGLYFQDLPLNVLKRQNSREERNVVNERQILTKAGVTAFFDTNFVGLGLGQFKSIVNFYPILKSINPEIALERKRKNEGLVTHNSYLQVLAECGIIGFLILIAFWIGKAREIVHNKRINLDVFFFQLGIASIILIYGYAHVVFLSPMMWFFLAFILPIRGTRVKLIRK